MEPLSGVAFLSPKGGPGKTTLSHLLALGSAWAGLPAWLCHTDARRPLRVNDRPYALIDARGEARLEEVSEMLARRRRPSGGYAIFDGGGNRGDADMAIALAMDLVLVPITPSAESIELGLDFLARLDQAGRAPERSLLVLNQISSNVHEATMDERLFSGGISTVRVLCRVQRVSAVRTLLVPDDAQPGGLFPTPPPRVNHLARALERAVSARLTRAEHLDPRRTRTPADQHADSHTDIIALA